MENLDNYQKLKKKELKNTKINFRTQIEYFNLIKKKFKDK